MSERERERERECESQLMPVFAESFAEECQENGNLRHKCAYIGKEIDFSYFTAVVIFGEQ